MSGISVIIPAYNREKLLPQTLESLLRQTLPAEEIIVVDDGSTDRTAAVAESFGEPVRVIHQENSGPAAARNRGFLESLGEFIHFFDSDDLALPNKHEVQMKALQESEPTLPMDHGSRAKYQTPRSFPRIRSYNKRDYRKIT